MNILVLGSGGREHAFAWKIAQSPDCTKLYVAPGNAGTSQIAENVAISTTDFDAIAQFCLYKNIELVIVGPEEPLVKGIADYFKSQPQLKNVLLVAPDQKGAMLEGSKDFAKQFMQKYQIPTAQYATFTPGEWEQAVAYLEKHTLPIVLKADGLAAGKGVVICQTHEEAKKTLEEMLLQQKFGEASAKVVVEQFLSGIELSVFVLTDGNTYKILPEAKDYKRIGEGDTGLNTGGMGAVSPVPFATKEFLQKVEQKIIQPTLKGIKAESIDYVGFIFIGLISVAGEPYVIEYNVRMGDPETEVVLPRIETDLVDLLKAAAQKRLNEVNLTIKKETATTIVLVSGGYPESYENGKLIKGLEKANEVLIFQAGTKTNEEQQVVTNGGRVIALTAFGNNIQDALEKSKKMAEAIEFEGKYYRRDIGLDLLGMN